MYNWIDTKLEYEQRIEASRNNSRQRVNVIGRVRLPKLNDLFKKSGSVR